MISSQEALVWVDGGLYLGFARGTAIERHLLVQGRVSLLEPGSPEMEKVWVAEEAKHGWRSPVVARVEPATVFTWKE